ncbi:MAG: alpha/beta hydrolase [Oceanidesulfovibrio sp.]
MQIALALVISFAGLCLLVYFMQNRLVFRPFSTLEADPSAFGLPFEDVRHMAEDGTRIHAWYIPGKAEGGGAGLSGVFCHGNAGNLSHILETMRILRELGMDMLYFDYRGYGESEGSPDEEGVAMDARAAYDWLVCEKGADPRRVVAWGRSLGGAVASRLAVEREVGALVLETAFTSIPEIGSHMYPLLPARWLATIKLPTIEYVRRVRAPVLVAHGAGDETVPYAMGRKLFAAANEPKTFLELAGGHNDFFLAMGEDYAAGVERFLETLPRPEARDRNR